MDGEIGSSIVNEMFGGPVGPHLLTGFKFFFEFAPIWLPLFLIFAACKLWVTYVRAEFIAKQETVLLDIRIPEIVDKSPAAMEAVLSVMFITGGESTFLDRLWLGKVRVWHSLELVSFGGQIHFYVWTRKATKQVVMNQLYSQYPSIEISEVPDYATRFDFSLEKYGVWGCDFLLSGGNPKPIKTYIDYGLDRDPKEEYKIDPMAALIEFLGSIGPRQQLWIQFVIRSHKGGLRDPKSIFKTRDFKSEAKEKIAGIFAKPEMVDISEVQGLPKTTKKLSKGQIEEISMIERKMQKYVFEGGIRVIYIAEKDAFEGTNIPGLIGIWRTFSAPGFNGFSPTRFSAKYDYPWDDYNGQREDRDKYKVFDAYRRRAWFFAPYQLSYSLFSTEEIATIWHFPGQAVRTPTLPRIPSTRQEPPANLPV